MSSTILTDRSDCTYCNGSMMLCPECGPFEYAPLESVGYAPDKGIHVASSFCGWEMSGMLPDWEDRANRRGWCMRDSIALLSEFYGRDRLSDMSMADSPILVLMGAI